MEGTTHVDQVITSERPPREIAVDIIDSSRWRWHYSCDADTLSGKVYLSESPFSSGIMSNGRLFNNDEYTFTTRYEWNEDEVIEHSFASKYPRHETAPFIEWDTTVNIPGFLKSDHIPQIVFIPNKDGYTLVLEYYTVSGEIIPLFTREIDNLSTIKIVEWCIEHRSRVYDEGFSLFGLDEKR